MREEKAYVVFDNYEQGIVINALFDLRNRLITDKRPTDAVDELIIKTANAPKKKMRISEKSGYEAR